MNGPVEFEEDVSWVVEFLGTKLADGALQGKRTVRIQSQMHLRDYKVGDRMSSWRTDSVGP